MLNARVMMVDDEPLMTELIQAHLEGLGYTNFVVCNDPRYALELMRIEKPGVLLLDLMMPHVSGFDLLQAIRADRALRYTPVIVLTASSGADSKLRALQLGATDFLGKPVDASELALRVRNTLAFQQYHSRMINFDQVTGLPRVGQFEITVNELLSEQYSGSGELALFSITVPQGRQIRESVGQASADAFAVEIARRLERSVGHYIRSDRRPRIAHLDELHYCLVVEGLNGPDIVSTIGKSIVSDLSAPVSLGTHESLPTPWVGIALAPDDGKEASALRQSADLAASRSQAEGVRVSYASPELNAQSLLKLKLAGQLRGAVQREELRLHYQPKFDITQQKIVGFEALVRWQHPELGLLQPGSFIALAEEFGLIVEMGQWVMERACLGGSALGKLGFGELMVAVNISQPQVAHGTLEAVIQNALHQSGLPAHLLVIELTESILMDDVASCVQLMQRLKAMGVKLSIDDFGTGYSSLAYLKQFPLDELKIDRSFVMDLPGLSSDRALVRTVIDLGHSFGMSVIAEGIETLAQLKCITQLGCDSFQGFLLSRPVPFDECKELLARATARIGTLESTD